MPPSKIPIYENLFEILPPHVTAIIDIITINATEISIEYFCGNTTAVIPTTAKPTPNNKIGFPRAFAYPFLSSVLSNTFPCTLA